jgi:ADP-ribose pyrophosphatase
MKPERLARKIIYESRWVNLYVDKVRFPNGLVLNEHHLLDFPLGAAAALVENEDGCIILVRVCRYTVGTERWEIPAGGMEAGESEIEAAQREVLEETGYTSEGHELIYSFYPMGGMANKLFHVVYCRAGERVRDFDADEVSETRWCTKGEVREMIRQRSITDGLTLTGLLLWLQADR